MALGGRQQAANNSIMDPNQFLAQLSEALLWESRRMTMTVTSPARSKAADLKVQPQSHKQTFFPLKHLP